VEEEEVGITTTAPEIFIRMLCHIAGQRRRRSKRDSGGGSGGSGGIASLTWEVGAFAIHDLSNRHLLHFCPNHTVAHGRNGLRLFVIITHRCLIWE